MGRTAFLVDGFNLYHSLKDAQLALGGQSTRWLDLRSFCSSYLPHIGRTARLSLAMENVVMAPRVISNCLPIITTSRSFVGSESRSTIFNSFGAALVPEFMARPTSA